MTHLDLCTGIGGFHLAAEWAGFETIAFSEIEPYCCQLLKEKWPFIPNYGDIRDTARFADLAGRVDVLSAGVPCQPASVAGKRRGEKDDRWLWPATLDVVECVRPAWAIFENPPGIVTLDEFGGVLSRLASLGYEVRLFSVSANSVGAKHRRERVFIVAHCARELRDGSGDTRQRRRLEPANSGETLADSDSAQRRPPQLPRYDNNGQAAFGWEEVPGGSERVCDPAFADSDSERELQQTGIVGAIRERTGDSRETLADTDQFDGNSSGSGAGEIPQFEASEILRGQTPADSDLTRFQERQRQDPGRTWPDSRSDSIGDFSRQSESGVCRVAHDVPPWPYEAMPTPLTKGKVPNRAARLKALGNSCVPYQILPFFQAIYRTLSHGN